MNKNENETSRPTTHTEMMTNRHARFITSTKINWKFNTKIKKMKAIYSNPEIELIKLDNEISLQLASSFDPMTEPDWTAPAQNSPMMMDDEVLEL